MTENESLLWMTVIAISAGVVAQVIAAIAEIPSIVVLFLLGILIGPEFLGFLSPDAFGEGLETIIKISVAIILFEAGLNLDRAEIQKHQKVILPLITIGGLITMILAAVSSKYIAGIDWSTAFLFGSLVIVTGPTVIHPLLRRVRVGTRLKNILESEGVFIDPIGAIIAIFIFELLLQKSSSILHGFSLAFLRLGIGALIGIAGGFIIGKIVSRWSLLMEETADLFVLASALGIYALSEAVILESGLMAAVASGAVLGNMDIPGEETLRKFKGKISILVISLLFILLAANLKLDSMFSIGWKGVIVVLVLIYIIRPAEIFLSTWKSDLNMREKIFLSYICPRGIVAASIASIFAIQLQNREMSGGYTIQGLVFLTIGISVLVQGLTANAVAKALGVLINSRKTVIVGASAFGRLVGKLLQLNGKEVSLIDTNENLVRIAHREGFQAIEGNSLDIDKLEEAGITEADTILAVTTSNKVNVLVSRLAKVDYEIKTVLPVLNQIEKSFDKETVNKLGLEIAFGKPLNMYDINPKIAHDEFKVFESVVEDEIVGKYIEAIKFPENLIPLILLRSKSKAAVICHSKLAIEKGDKIFLLDLSRTTVRLPVSGFKDYRELNPYAGGNKVSS